MPNHESHEHHGPGPGPHGHGPGTGHGGHGHHGHGPGMMGAPGPIKLFVVNAIVTQMFARVFMVIAGVALLKMAHAMALGARVKTYAQLRDDLSEEQRAELLDDIWSRARRKKMANCPVMPACCSPKAPAAQ
jgi:hypothetical protein